jgi:hypothetical protein
MRKTKKIRINPRTRVPLQVPETATEHISLRVTPAMKEYFRNQSDRHDLSITKYIFNIFDFHFAHHVSNEFVLENSGYTNAGHRVAVKSKSDGSYWDGMQKVWDFFKGV